MSRVVRRKHVLKEMMDDDYALPKEHQTIVQIVGSRGNNLHEVMPPEPEEAQTYLASMPNKFRNNVYVKRGDFVLVEPIKEGDKVKAEICKILTAEHVKEYTKAGVWPKKFTKKREHDESTDQPLKNPNRPMPEDASDNEGNSDSSSD